MILQTKRDIFEIKPYAIVNTVNCVGVMGKGLALQFKERYPANFREYAIACAQRQVQPGKMFITLTGTTAPAMIINFPTKRHWRDQSLLGDIVTGLRALKHEIIERKIESIAIPPLGCGLGGLNWYTQVHPLICQYLSELDAQIHVITPR